jgi:hypothetical protein
MVRTVRGVGVPARALAGAAILSAFLLSCTEAPRNPRPDRADEVGPASPSPQPTADGRAVTGDCVNGYETLTSGEPGFRRPLHVIARTAGVPNAFRVEEMRYFEGPESPPSEMGYLALVKRWYVKARLEGRPGWQARFLVEERDFGTGLTAVAPFDTMGFSSPDWRAFQWEGVDSKPVRYPGLPGKWPGTTYDFVLGGAGIDIRGLPREVIGCLDGT